MLRIKHNQGFASLAEVLVTAVIFTLAAVGIFTTIAMLQPQGMDSQQRLQAAYIGQSVIEQLRGYVDARVWDNAQSPLAVNIVHSQVVGNYTVNWYLQDVPNLGVRQITMNVYSK